MSCLLSTHVLTAVKRPRFFVLFSRILVETWERMYKIVSQCNYLFIFYIIMTKTLIIILGLSKNMLATKVHTFLVNFQKVW